MAAKPVVVEDPTKPAPVVRRVKAAPRPKRKATRQRPRKEGRSGGAATRVKGVRGRPEHGTAVGGVATPHFSSPGALLY